MRWWTHLVRAYGREQPLLWFLQGFGTLWSAAANPSVSNLKSGAGPVQPRQVFRPSNLISASIIDTQRFQRALLDVSCLLWLCCEAPTATLFRLQNVDTHTESHSNLRLAVSHLVACMKLHELYFDSVPTDCSLEAYCNDQVFTSSRAYLSDTDL